jgi:hypothetical protein
MKRISLVVLVAIAAALPACAQTSSVTLQNQEAAVFWYAVDPPGLEDLSVGSRQLAARVQEYFAQESEDFPFRALAPDTPAVLTGLPAGAHLVVGFFLVEGEEELPVRAFSVQVDPGAGDRFYALFSGPALLTIRRGAGRLANLERQGAGNSLAAAEAPTAVAGVEAPAAEVAVEGAAVVEAPAAEVAVEGAAVVEAPAAEAVSGDTAVGEAPAAEAIAAETMVEGATVEAPAVEAPEVEAAAAETPEAEAAAVEAPAAEGAVAEEPAAQAEAEAAVEAPAEVAAAETPAPVEDAAPAEVAAFSASYSPVVFTMESKNGFTVLPIARSLYWGEPGTRLDGVEGIIRNGALELTVRTQDGFSPDVSYFFYVFGERTLGRENAVTFELLPLAREGRGALVLWQKAPGGQARAVPRFVGTTSTYGRECTVILGLDELPPGVLAATGGNPSIDLSSCRYDSGKAVFEEFYFTSLQLADFPTAAVTR